MEPSTVVAGAAAGESCRVEAKHIAEPPQVAMIHKHVAPLLRPDVHGKEYEVSTVYHDTPDKACFRAADEAYPDRFKIRSRTYNGKGDEHHELKARKGDISLKRGLSQAEFKAAMKSLKLEPAVEVKYDREAYEDEVDGEPFRMTIDRGIRARDANKSKWIDVFPNGTMIVEIKTPRELNQFARRISRIADLRRAPISKFVASLRKANAG